MGIDYDDNDDNYDNNSNDDEKYMSKTMNIFILIYSTYQIKCKDIDHKYLQ